MAKKTATKPAAMNNALFDKILKTSKSSFAAPLLESQIFTRSEEFCPTDVPLLNLALSGRFLGGVGTGVSLIAGPSKHFKTLFGLKMMEAFSRLNADGIMIFYDSEFGSTKAYLETYDIDLSRIVHVPVSSLEELRTEAANQIDVLMEEFQTTKVRPKVFIFLDSLGNLASNKETEDAISGKNKADMTRAKVAKSIFRIITPKINLLGIPMVVVGHSYKSQDMYPVDIVSGGTGPMYSANTVFVIGKQQDKANTGEIMGYKFIIKIEKSRYIKEKSKLPITVHYDKGILPFSGLAELATQMGIIKQIKIGRSAGFSYHDDEYELDIPASEIDSSNAFWEAVFAKSDFLKRVETYYSLSSKEFTGDQIVLEEDMSEAESPEEE